MKRGLLESTALIGVTALMAGTAAAAEAPTWKLTGNMNFQFYWVEQDATGIAIVDNIIHTDGLGNIASATGNDPADALAVFGAGTGDFQDHDWYFGVDEAELQLNVSGTADNGLNYGFKIEINANTTDTKVADEARLQLSGGWGTLQMGDEDGAEDIMNYGGENLMGATGGFDGDQDDYLLRAGSGVGYLFSNGGVHYSALPAWNDPDKNALNLAAPGGPTIAGDTSDQTKISYFSPRFAGFQVGASLTPTPNNGDDFKADGAWENHYGIGANYDNSFGGVRVRASAVYSASSDTTDLYEDVSAWSVGGIVGFGPFSLGANYTDNGDSGQPIWENQDGDLVTVPVETSYWNVAAGFETGPMYFSAGYFAAVKEVSIGIFDDSTYEHIALTADYTVAPGLGFYAEVNLISDEILGEPRLIDGDPPAISEASTTNDTMSLILGANVSF